MNTTLVLTHDCNLACEYCYSGDKKDIVMSEETAFKAIDFAFDNSSDTKMGLGFFGGEPLLQWELLQKSVEYFHKQLPETVKTVGHTVTTNGTLLTKDKLQWLIDNKFRLGLSIDGNQKSHDALRKLRNGDGSFDQCSRSIKDFVEMKPNGSVISVIDPKNVKDMYKGIVWLYEQGINHLSLSMNFYTEWSRKDLANLKKMYRKLKPFFVKCAKSDRPLHISTISNKIVTGLSKGCRRDRCDFGDKTIVIAPSGNIYPCDRVVGNDDDTNIQMGNIDTGFDLKQRKRIVSESGNSNEECNSCAYQSRCVNWCGCVNYLTTGEIGKADGLICVHEKITIDIADEIIASVKNISFV